MSVALLLFVANLALSIRLASSSVLGAIWAAAVAVVCAVVGFRACVHLRDVRQMISSSS